MGLFDDYFDPQQFGEGGGGLLGRLLALQQQGQYRPSELSTPSGGQPDSGVSGNPPQDATAMAAPQAPMPMPALVNNGPPPPVLQTPDYGQTLNIPVGTYQMPQFGRVDPSQPAQQTPDLGDRLSAGFQSWAHTPVGNPFAALANGVAGFNSGQRTGQMTAPQRPNSGDEATQPSAGDGQAAAFTPTNPQTVNKPVMRVLTSRIVTRPNSRSSRYGG
jgi:hypothetical protein